MAERAAKEAKAAGIAESLPSDPEEEQVASPSHLRNAISQPLHHSSSRCVDYHHPPKECDDQQLSREVMLSCAVCVRITIRRTTSLARRSRHTSRPPSTPCVAKKTCHPRRIFVHNNSSRSSLIVGFVGSGVYGAQSGVGGHARHDTDVVTDPRRKYRRALLLDPGEGNPHNPHHPIFCVI